MTQAVGKLELETAIQRTYAAILVMSELLDATFDMPDKRVDHLQHYSFTDGQVDARLESMSHAVETAEKLRDMFQAYVLCERERKAVKA
ncbi:hypothetical protein [Kaistia terrae]|uniref:Uncharacterized protein n=1 Tax=Kaistia terrae TaxID=537017 RepID=A0ABW0Q2P6_9HYPH|nr:hypothetical protein [Kaistia terrae]MCX5581577.1 hypothetical protein [Kaistia terrae]